MGGVESDEWMSAYVAHALAETGIEEARTAACRAWRRLELLGCSHAPGLGYNSQTPQDADSSAYGVRLAIALGEPDCEMTRACLECVRSHMRPEAGVATYNAPELLRRRMGESEDAVAGWTAPHVCVSAAAANIPEFAAGVRTYLADRQDEDGRWRAYWWEDDEYATALAVESLADQEAYSNCVERATSWLSRPTATASAFALALRVFGLRKAGSDLWQRPAMQLVALQLSDGSWPASARMRMPPPDLLDPRSFLDWDDHSTGIGCVMADRNRLFTTATALRALTACLKD